MEYFFDPFPIKGRIFVLIKGGKANFSIVMWCRHKKFKDTMPLGRDISKLNFTNTKVYFATL